MKSLLNFSIVGFDCAMQVVGKVEAVKMGFKPSDSW